MKRYSLSNFKNLTPGNLSGLFFLIDPILFSPEVMDNLDNPENSGLIFNRK